MSAQMQSSERQRILVVDDEPSIVDAVATALRYEGYDVEEATTGREALSAVARFEPDLVVLDWMLPDVEGIEVGRRLRERGFKTAVLFLTAKDATENKVEALRAGGDDYVTKPFSLAEIVARVQAILRRTQGALPGDVLTFADLTLDEQRHEVFRGDTRVELTGTEFNLLRYFMLDRVDNTLNAVHPGAEQLVFGRGRGPGPGDLGNQLADTCIQVRHVSGPVVATHCTPAFPGGETPPTPAFPESISLPDDPNTPQGDRVHFLTVGSEEGDDRYRVRASIEASAPGYVLLIAEPLHDVDSTLHRLLLIEVLVTSAALAGLDALGLWVVRLGLRPLRRIEETATAITAG